MGDDEAYQSDGSGKRGGSTAQNDRANGVQQARTHNDDAEPRSDVVAKRKCVKSRGAVILCGTATAIAGPIAFVGLIVPHVMRLVLGAERGGEERASGAVGLLQHERVGSRHPHLLAVACSTMRQPPFGIMARFNGVSVCSPTMTSSSSEM